LLPLAVILWIWQRRERWTLVLTATLSVGALIQLLLFVRTGDAARVPGTLGASPLWLARILAAQIFLGSLIGKNDMPSRRVYAVVIAIVGIAILLYVLWNARREVQLFIAFACMVLAGSLINPTAPAPKWLNISPQWGMRYWFLPMLAFVVALVWMAGNGRPRSVRLTAAVILSLMSVGIVRDWRYRPFSDLQFGDYARTYSSMPRGSNLVIPLNPRGWSMTLTKQ
jgi:hypothetical protein